MQRLLALLALLSATPAVAQWTVSTFAGGAATFDPLRDPSLPLASALNPGGNVYVSGDNKIWRVRAGTAERIAGTGVAGFAGDGGPATQALLYFPIGMQADAAGNVYFFDSLNYRIRRIDTNGIITTVAGTGQPWVPGLDLDGPATSRSVSPGNFVVRRSGEVYFTDLGVNAILRLTLSSRLELVASFSNDCSCSPTLLTLDGAGNVFFVSGGRNIQRVSTDGIITTLASLNGQIFSMVVDASSDVYTTHQIGFGAAGSTDRISPDGSIQFLPLIVNVVLDATGQAVYALGGKLYDARTGTEIATIPASNPAPVVLPSPDGTQARDVRFVDTAGFQMVVSHAGELHFREACSIRKFDRDGILRTVAPIACLAPNLSMTFDSRDRLWVTNTATGTVTISPDGTTVQPVFPAGLFPPGTGGSELAFDGKDRLYVVSNTSLKRLETDGTVVSIFPPVSVLPDLPFPEASGKDPAGNVYFGALDHTSLQRRAYRINDDGSATRVLGTFPNDRFPRFFFVDAAGSIWQGLSFINSQGTFNLGLRSGVYPTDGGLVQSTLESFGVGGRAGVATPAPDATIYVWDGVHILKLSPIGQTLTPLISSGGIVNSASYISGSIAPGELISIFGFNFGAPTNTVQLGQAVNNTLPSAVGRTKVLFGNIEGKITAVTSAQINVFVPYGVTIGTLLDIVVLVDDAPSLPMRVPVEAQAFSLFTLNSSGSGQGAILNQDGSVNGPLNPARRGSFISLFGTGAGVLSPALPDGALVISTPFSKPGVPVIVKIDGQLAEVTYAGAAPSLPNGAFQINVRIPAGAPQLSGSDSANISVTVGSSTTTRNVTVAVQ